MIILVKSSLKKKGVVTPHLNCVRETVQMRGHKIYGLKIILQLSSNTPLIWRCTLDITLVFTASLGLKQQKRKAYEHLKIV